MTKPRVGFLGTGWIGRHRMEAMLATGAVEAVGVADPSDAAADDALALAPDARRVDGLEALLDLGLDGVVVATPSADHAAQTVRALERGVAVFCQKPLGRTAAEVRGAVDAARSADRLLAVDLSYRFTAGAHAVRELVRSGESSTTPMGRTSPGSAIRSNRAAAACWISASTSSTWPCGCSTSPSRPSPPPP